ncbi:unnamed protein product [Linum tenue]|uniref:Pectinesterase inhibitor domain-containing protein n=1 Tax=Linum tenue TaxID=586396 RepID=A0AAV0RGV1_9ROSI|nr:unnamed protein product [Linum tenue]
MIRSTIFLLLLLTLYPISCIEATASIPNILGNNLIDQTCKKTPYYDLCIQTLVSCPESFHTDLEGLAKITVGAIAHKASAALRRIETILAKKEHSKPAVREALNACASRYRAVVEQDVPETLMSLRTGNYKFASRGTNDAATEAMSCEEDFAAGESPLSDLNVAVHDVSVVAAAIVQAVIES